MPTDKPVAVVSHWSGLAGPQIVQGLEQAGFYVVVSAPEQELLMAGLGQSVLAVDFDPAFEPSVKKKMAEVFEDFGRVDVLVNNPLAWQDAALNDITESMWADTFTNNFKATFYMSRALAPAMVAQGAGRIINVSSSAGLSGAFTPYAAACAAVMSLTRSLSIEMAPHVRVNCIATGLLDEPWIDEAGPKLRASLEGKVPLNRLLQPVDVAEFVAFLATGGDFFTGQTFILDGGEIRR